MPLSLLGREYIQTNKGVCMKMRKRLLAIMLSVLCVGAWPVVSYADSAITLAIHDLAAEKSLPMTLNGDASVRDGALYLTHAAGDLYGSSFYAQSVSLSNYQSFSAHFSFQITSPTCTRGLGGDGLAFVIHSNSSMSKAYGQGLGYSGLSSSLAVEFDTFENGIYSDPDNNHIGINLNGDLRSIVTAKAPFFLNDGVPYYTWVDYNGATNVLEIRISDGTARPSAPVLAHTVDLSGVLKSEVFFGFSAATGSCNQQHLIKSLYFHKDFIAEGIDPVQNEYFTDRSK